MVCVLFIVPSLPVKHIDTEPVRSRLTSLELAMTLLRLSGAIYPAGSWLRASPSNAIPEEEALESWNLRTGLSNWAWRVIEELSDDGN